MKQNQTKDPSAFDLNITASNTLLVKTETIQERRSGWHRRSISASFITHTRTPTTIALHQVVMYTELLHIIGMPLLHPSHNRRISKLRLLVNIISKTSFFFRTVLPMCPNFSHPIIPTPHRCLGYWARGIGAGSTELNPFDRP